MTLTQRWEQFLGSCVAAHFYGDARDILIRVLAEHDAATTCRRCGKRCADDGVPECSSCLEAGDGPAEQPEPAIDSILAAAENYRRVWHGGEQHDEAGTVMPPGNICGYCNKRFATGERMCCDAGYLADRVASLEAKVAAERSRCLWFAVRSHYGLCTPTEAFEAIRDGKAGT